MKPKLYNYHYDFSRQHSTVPKTSIPEFGGKKASKGREFSHGSPMFQHLQGDMHSSCSNPGEYDKETNTLGETEPLIVVSM